MIKLIDFKIANIVIPGSVFMYPLIYVLINIITEGYGEKIAYRTLILGIGSVAFYMLMILILLYMPGSGGFYQVGMSFNDLIGNVDSIVIGILISYLVGCSITIKLTGIISRSSWKFKYKNFFAMIIGLLVDDLVYTTIASMGHIPLFDLLTTFWIVDILCIIIAEPFTLRIIKWAKSY